MTHEEHQQRHVALHRALDELIADFIGHGDIQNDPRLPSGTTVARLMEWSYQQTIEPDVRRGEEQST